MKVLLLFLLSLTLSPALHAAIDLASLVPAVAPCTTIGSTLREQAGGQLDPQIPEQKSDAKQLAESKEPT